MADIDWSKPIETVAGVPARFIQPHLFDGGGVIEVPSLDTGDTGPWLYDPDGTVANDFLPDLRNVAA